MTILLKLDIKKSIGILLDGKNNLIKKFYLKKKNNDQKLTNEFCGYKWYFNIFTIRTHDVQHSLVLVCIDLQS